MINQRQAIFDRPIPNGVSSSPALSLFLSRSYCYERAVHANVSTANRMFYRLMHVHTRREGRRGEGGTTTSLLCAYLFRGAEISGPGGTKSSLREPLIREQNHPGCFVFHYPRATSRPFDRRPRWSNARPLDTSERERSSSEGRRITRGDGGGRGSINNPESSEIQTGRVPLLNHSHDKRAGSFFGK